MTELLVLTVVTELKDCSRSYTVNKC